jgi:hypothetical protein
VTTRRAILIVLAAFLAGYVAWDRIEAHGLAADIAAVAKRGEPVDLSFRDAPLPTPQHLEAAQLYAEATMRAAEMVQRDFRLPRIDFDGVTGVPVAPADIKDTFPLDCPALQLLDRAAPLPFAGMGEFAPEYYYDNGSELQNLSALSALRADILSYRNDPDGAVDAIASALRVQRTLPGLFYRYIAGSRVFGSVRILLRHTTPSEAALAKLQKAFSDLSDDDGLTESVRERRAAYIVRLDNPSSGVLEATAAAVLHPYLTSIARQQLEQFDVVAAAVQQPWPDKIQALAALVADRDVGQPRQGVLSVLPTYAFRNVAIFSADFRSAGLNLVIRRAAIVTLAIERYRRAHSGTPPPSLAALVPVYLVAVPADPFSGQDLIYRREADDYLVYSVDVNRKDDGGALYGFGSREPNSAAMKPTRDFGIKVPLVVTAR